MTRLHRIAPAAAAAVALLALGGCATEGDIESLRTEIAGLRSSIESVDAKATRAEGGLAEAGGRRRPGRGCRQRRQRQGRSDLPRRPAQVALAAGAPHMCAAPRLPWRQPRRCAAAGRGSRRAAIDLGHQEEHEAPRSCRCPRSRLRYRRRSLFGAIGALGRPRCCRRAAGAWPRPTGDLIGEPTYYLTQGDETLLEVALERNLGVPEISAVNPGVDPWVPVRDADHPADPVHPARRAARGHRGQLRRAARVLFPQGRPVQTYAIGIGRDGFELKMGRTTIVRKKEKPTWYPTESTLRDKP